MNNQKVSIIIPVYNTESYLPRCLDSLLAQTYTDFEIICVDDGSSDNSGRICDEYVRKDSRIRVVHIPNGGVSNARNTGLDLAKGEYILFVDSDDWVEPEHVHNMLPKGNEELVRAGFKRIINGQFVDETIYADLLLDAEALKTSFREYWLHLPFWAVWGGCYNNRIIQDYHIRFDSSMELAEDVLFTLNYLPFCNKIRISSVTSYCYKDGDNHSLVHKYCPMRLIVEKKICEKIDELCQRQEYSIRWFNWHVVFGHYYARIKEVSAEVRRDILQKLSEAYADPYFRECIPYIRKHGTLDEKIETYFMSAWAHPLYKPFYSIIAALSRMKNAVLKRK